METPLYYLPHFFQILSNPPLPCRLQPRLPLLFLLSCFFGWMSDRATLDVLFYLMIYFRSTHVEPWYLSTRMTLMCALATRHQVYWGMTHNVGFCRYSNLISHTHKVRPYNEGPVGWHTHKNTYLHHLLCAHSSYLYYIEWIITDIKNLLSTMSFLFKNNSIVKVIYLLIEML